MTIRLFVRTFAFVAVCAAFAGACYARGLALTEFCPARVGGFQAFTDSGPSTLYSYSLTAESARSVQGVLMAETSSGWYEVRFPLIPLAQRRYEYTGQYGDLSRTGYESDPLYVRFPAVVTVDAVYVVQAQTQGEHDFGWDGKGEFTCFPDPERVPIKEPVAAGMTVAHSPRLALAASPSPQASIAVASPAAPPDSPSCDEPFAPAGVTKPMSPDYPQEERNRRTPGMAVVEVVINAAGQLTDSWLYLSSGSATIDASAVQAANESTYHAGRMFCRAVGGQYLFVARYFP
jgi:TonB family protein